MEKDTKQVNTSGIDLQIMVGDALRVAKRMLWLGVLLVVLAGAFLGWREYKSYVPMYKATASFTVTVRNPMYAGTMVYNAAAAEQMVKTFPVILSTGVLRSRVQEKLGISWLPNVTAGVLGNTNIFTLTVTATNPELAHNVLEAVMECYPEVADFVVGPTDMVLLNDSGVPSQPYNQRSFLPGFKKGALIGVALWVVLVLVVTLSHVTIHNEDELKRMTNLRCLGTLPNISRKQRGDWLRIALEGDRYGFSESVRLLRIRVEKEMEARQQKVLLVSSAIPGEGKTTVSTSLAMSLAQKNKRVLIVDLDLRNPSVNQVFGKKPTPGITDVLAGKAQFQDLLVRLPVEELYGTFAGAPADNAAELLGRPELKAFVEQAKEVFDYVILDTPPCAMLADAAEAAALADCAILTIRQSGSTRDQILEGAQMLTGNGLQIIGCVLNGVRRDVFAGSDEYDAYGYAYGYGNTKNKKAQKAQQRKEEKT